jgi:hypothetical protein
MDAVLSVIALMFVLFMAVSLVVAVRTVRAVRRRVQRTGAQARRVVEETTLKAKAFAQAGPAAELASLRLNLRTSMTGTRQALETGVAGDASLREALGLFDRLRPYADALDDELKLLEREPDRGRIEARLPELRERAQRVTHSADALRWAAQDRARQFAEDELALLGREIEIEAGAIRHWAPEGVTGPRDA